MERWEGGDEQSLGEATDEDQNQEHLSHLVERSSEAQPGALGSEDLFQITS
jgi:hypothetical protein